MNKLFSLLAVGALFLIAISAYNLLRSPLEGIGRAPASPFATTLAGTAAAPATVAATRTPAPLATLLPATQTARPPAFTAPSGTAARPAVTAAPSGATTPAPSLSTAPASKPAATAPPLPISTPAAAPMVGRSEAEGVVRSYFQALHNKDFALMRALTTGQARQVTDGLIDQITREESRLRAQSDIRVARLDIDGVDVQPEQTRVDATFVVEVYGRVGPLSTKVATQSGQGAFFVRRVDGQAKIVEIGGQFS